MGKILTVAQKTFTDLYDSYVLNLSSDIVAVPCDQDGKATEECITTITYSAAVGISAVGATCAVKLDTVPTGVTYEIISSTDATDGEIKIAVAKGTVLADDSEIGFTFTTTNSHAFTFTRYITFIKISKGEDGENARSFQIKSEQGDTFVEGVDKITMTAVAFDGLTEITDATYAWSYCKQGSGWMPVLGSDEATGGQNDTQKAYSGTSLTVCKTDSYANSVFKCTITYNDGETDEDYYQLKTATYNYESVVKFFNGTNTLASSDPFLVAHVDLYKDNQKEEVVEANYYYYHEDNTDESLNFEKVDSSYEEEGNLMYVIYKNQSAFPNSTSSFYTISTDVSPVNKGTVSGGGDYDYGTNIKLTAIPNDGYKFEKWNDGDTSNPRTITVLERKTYTASFAVRTSNLYTITAGPNDSTMGSVSLSDSQTVSGLYKTGNYEKGTMVTLTAMAYAGYVFEDWYENNEANNWTKSTNITVDRDRTLTAKFRRINVEENIEIIATGQGRNIHVYKDKEILLKFVPEVSGTYKFYSEENVPMSCNLYDSDKNNLASGTPGSDGDNFSISFDYEANKTYYFGITISEYDYSSAEVLVYLQEDFGELCVVTLAGNSPGCEWVDGEGSYEKGTTVTVTAMASDEYGFNYWLNDQGAQPSNSRVYSFVIERSITLTPVFYKLEAPDEEIPMYFVEVIADPKEGGTVTGGGYYAEGATADISATPNSGYEFQGWSSNASSVAISPIGITVLKDEKITAYFKEKEKCTITVTSNSERYGSVTGSGTYVENTVITITAISNAGYQFVKWSDGNTENPRDITVTSEAVYEAIFEPIPTVKVTILADPSSGGVVKQNGSTVQECTYDTNSFVTLEAQPNEEYEFLYWTDGAQQIANETTTIFPTTDVTWTAVFSDGGNDTEETIIVNETKTANIDAGKTVYFKFTPSTSGTYQFTSLGTESDDVVGYLYDANRSQITSNDDGAGNRQFLITHELTAATTYYWGIKYYSDSKSGSVNVKLVFISDSGGDSGDNTGGDTGFYTFTTVADPTIGGIVTQNGNEISSGTYENGELVWLNAIARNGYQFIGWYENGELKEDWDAEVARFATSNSTFTAKFQLLSSYSLRTMSLDNTINATAVEDETTTKKAKYKAALYKYNSSTGKWELTTDDNKYVYKNDLYNDVTSNVLVISKEDVSNYRNIDFTVYKKVLENGSFVFDNDLIISRASTTVFDLNDPILGGSAPQDAKDGQLWLDTSCTPYTLHICQDGKWTYFNPQAGKTIHTSEPETYSEGDIWILSAAYDKNGYYYGKGSMLTATETVIIPGGFSITHWDYMDSEITNIVANVKESFSWDDTGVNIAQKMTYSSGKITTPFYVHIDSQRMGFHSVSDDSDVEVVHIGNNSAEIKNATFDGSDGTTFNNDASFYNQVNILNKNDDGTEVGFSFQTEENGSFSLVLIKN